MASSVITSTPIIVGTALSIPVGLAFNGTPLPLIGATSIFAAVAAVISLRLSVGAVETQSKDRERADWKDVGI